MPPNLLTAPRLRIVAYGTPAPQGSKRYVGNGVMIDQNASGLRTWREDVKLAALRALEEMPGWDRDYPALVGHFAFTLARPRNHYRTGKFANVVQETAPYLHASRPDLDKLLRSTWDALTSAGVYRDDSRLAQVHAVKVYTSADADSNALDRPGARIVLTGVGR